MMNFRRILTALGLIRDTLRISKDGTTVIGYDGSQRNIVIPESVTKIENRAFNGCSGLISIVIPESVTEIGNEAFNGCSGLTSIVIPKSVTSIGIGAFCGCSGLTSIVIFESVTEIGSEAFNGCSGLTSIVIPKSVTSIGKGAFIGCSGLTSIVVSKDNKRYDSRENCNAIIDTESNELISGCSGTEIPKSVTSIGEGAFSGCDKLTILRKSKEKKEFEKQLLLAQQGDAEAQYHVYTYYFHAKGTKQNLSEADKWLKESAKNGFGPAYYEQALLLEQNNESGSNAETIFSLKQKALDNGYTFACFSLGDMCLKGFGCEKSVEKALKIFRVAHKKELERENDGRLGLNSFLNDLADVNEEMHTICKKAQSGDGDAFYQLGVLLWHKQEYDLSYKFMVASAAFGCMDGVYELGRDYYYGYGVEADIEVAEDLWTYAASHGNAAALRELGDLCTDREEYEQAYRYYLDSAKRGDDKGRIGVAECCLKGSGCEKNVPEAIKWLNNILEKNNAQPSFNWNTQWVQCAMLWLGGIYLGQEGDEFKNMNKAIATLKDGLKLKDRFTTEIAQVLAYIYGNKNGDYYNPLEAKKYQKIAEESQGPGNVKVNYY